MARIAFIGAGRRGFASSFLMDIMTRLTVARPTEGVPADGCLICHV